MLTICSAYLDIGKTEDHAFFCELKRGLLHDRFLLSAIFFDFSR